MATIKHTGDIEVTSGSITIDGTAVSTGGGGGGGLSVSSSPPAITQPWLKGISATVSDNSAFYLQEPTNPDFVNNINIQNNYFDQTLPAEFSALTSYSGLPSGLEIKTDEKSSPFIASTSGVYYVKADFSLIVTSQGDWYNHLTSANSIASNVSGQFGNLSDTTAVFEKSGNVVYYHTQPTPSVDEYDSAGSFITGSSLNGSSQGSRLAIQHLFTEPHDSFGQYLIFEAQSFYTLVYIYYKQNGNITDSGDTIGSGGALLDLGYKLRQGIYYFAEESSGDSRLVSFTTGLASVSEGTNWSFQGLSIYDFEIYGSHAYIVANDGSFTVLQKYDISSSSPSLLWSKTSDSNSGNASSFLQQVNPSNQGTTLLFFDAHTNTVNLVDGNNIYRFEDSTGDDAQQSYSFDSINSPVFALDLTSGYWLFVTSNRDVEIVNLSNGNKYLSFETVRPLTGPISFDSGIKFYKGGIWV